MHWNLYNSSGAYVRSLNYRESDGRFYVEGYIHSTGDVYIGSAGTYITTEGNIEFTGGMATGMGANLWEALNARIKNDGGTYGINITGNAATASRAYPRRSDGGSINFVWFGQGGQPTWLWGGTDGVNMYVYNPANFSVNYANGAGYAASADNADTVDGLHASAFMPAPYMGGGINDTNFPIGHVVLLDAYHNRNNLVNVYISSGVIGYNYSSGTLLAGSWRMRGSFSSPRMGIAQRVA